MKKRFSTIFIFLLLLNVFSFAQQKSILEQIESKEGLGEGVIVITLYSAIGQNYKHIDTTGASTSSFKTAYFIKGNMILKPYMKDNIFYIEKENSGVSEHVMHTEKNIGEAVVTSTFSAHLTNPKSLIDFKRKKYYTFFSKDKKPHVSVYAENEQYFEYFYVSPKPDTTGFKILSLDETKSFVVSGFTCFQGMGISHSDTLYFSYTRDLKKIKSPLNLMPFFKHFPYDVISCSGPSSGSKSAFTDSAGVVTEPVTTLATVTITYLKERKLDDSLFKIPKGITILKNVPYKEIQNYELKM